MQTNTEPTHGYTSTGNAVHANTVDHHPVNTNYQRFNKTLAVFITKNEGTMTSAYCFMGLALLSLPAVLAGFHVFHHTFPTWITSVSVIAMIAWIAQTFLQLVLLPVIIVGQNVQAEAADARSTKTFEDVEIVVDRLDIRTEGGLKDAVDVIVSALREKN